MSPMIALLCMVQATFSAGNTWVRKNPANYLPPVRSMNLHGNQLIMGSTRGTVHATEDGTNWTNAAPLYWSTAVGRVEKIGDTLLVLTDVQLGDGDVYRSIDGGANWTRSYFSETNWAADICSNGEYFLLLLADGALLRSTDGLTWVNQGRLAKGDLHWVDGKWILYAESNVFTSSDGRAWGTAAVFRPVGYQRIRRLRSGVAISTTGELCFYRNGIDTAWCRKGNFSAAADSGDHVFLFKGAGDSMMEISRDNVARASRIEPAGSFYSAMFFNGKFYAQPGTLAGTGSLLTSDDGIHWHTLSPGITQDLTSITYGNGRFVVAGGKGTLAWSKDGSQWNQAASGTTKQLNSVVWNGAGFLATGDSGMVLKSADGVDWSILPAGSRRNHSKTIWDGARYLTVQDSAVLESQNGETWTPILRDSAGMIWDIASDGHSVMATAGKRLWFSPDGRNWQKRSSSNYSAYITISTSDSGYLVTRNGAYTLILVKDLTQEREISYGRDIDVVTAAGSHAGAIFAFVGKWIFRWGKGWACTREASPPGMDYILGMASGGGRLMAVGYGGQILSWEPEEPVSGRRLDSTSGTRRIVVHEGGGRFRLMLPVDPSSVRISTVTGRRVDAVVTRAGEDQLRVALPKGSQGILLLQAAEDVIPLIDLP